MTNCDKFREIVAGSWTCDPRRIHTVCGFSPRRPLADRLGQKPMLVICLAVWVGLLVAAYFVTSQRQFWMLGAVLALVMGGTQSVSRAIMGVMTPPGRTAEFFGFYNFSGKATSFMGTFLYGLIIVTTKSPRLGILSLLVFFLIGWAFVGRINIKKGRRQALEA